MGKGMVALPQLSGRGSCGATQPSKSPVKSLARDTKYELQFGPKDQRALETAFGGAFPGSATTVQGSQYHPSL